MIGIDKTIKCIEDGKVSQVFYSEELKGTIIFFQNNSLGKKLTKQKKLDNVPPTPTIIEEEFEFERVPEDGCWEMNICDWLMKKQTEKKFELEVIGCVSAGGRRFLKGFSGLASTLKTNLFEYEAPVELLDM